MATSVGALPKTATRPEVERSRPSIILMVVLFPLPLGPRSPKTSRGRISQDRFVTARARARIQKSLSTLVRFWQTTTASVRGVLGPIVVAVCVIGRTSGSDLVGRGGR